MTAAERQLELALQQARYEAAHARRQYDAVDPVNRLVAGELERRWNEALQTVARIEADIAAMVARRPPPLGDKEREQLMALGLTSNVPGRIRPRQLRPASAFCARRSRK